MLLNVYLKMTSISNSVCCMDGEIRDFGIFRSAIVTAIFGFQVLNASAYLNIQLLQTEIQNYLMVIHQQ